jgi:hypothetical protein
MPSMWHGAQWSFSWSASSTGTRAILGNNGTNMPCILVNVSGWTTHSVCAVGDWCWPRTLQSWPTCASLFTSRISDLLLLTLSRLLGPAMGSRSCWSITCTVVTAGFAASYKGLTNVWNSILALLPHRWDRWQRSSLSGAIVSKTFEDGRTCESEILSGRRYPVLFADDVKVVFRQEIVALLHLCAVTACLVRDGKIGFHCRLAVLATDANNDAKVEVDAGTASPLQSRLMLMEAPLLMVKLCSLRNTGTCRPRWLADGVVVPTDDVLGHETRHSSLKRVNDWRACSAIKVGVVFDPAQT